MRRLSLAAWMLVSLLGLGSTLAGCPSVTQLTDDTVRTALRDTGGELSRPEFREGLRAFAESPEVRGIVQQLTRDLIATSTDELSRPEIEAHVRSLILAALDALGERADPVRGAMREEIAHFLDQAEAMVDHIVAHAMTRLTHAVTREDLRAWVALVLEEMRAQLASAASAMLAPGVGEQVGTWLGEVLHAAARDVDARAEVEELARAAGRGLGNGFGEALDDRLGDALMTRERELVDHLHEEADAAARPWVIGFWIAIAAAVIAGGFWLRKHLQHRAVVDELERAVATDDSAAGALHQAHRRGAAPRPPTSSGPRSTPSPRPPPS